MDKAERKLNLQAQIDCIHWMLGEMLAEEKTLSPLSKTIDESTGFSKIKVKKAKALIKQVQKLKKEFYSL